MESKKVKVKLVVGYKQYRVIEVEESEVEKIREVNRMTWRELKQEVRKKESMVKANIIVDSIEDIEEEFESIPDPNAVNPIDEMIEAEEKQEKYAPLYQAITQLTERQQEMVRMVYFEGMSQDEVAKHFGIAKSSVSEAMQRIYASLKRFLEKFKKNARRPRTEIEKVSFYK